MRLTTEQLQAIIDRLIDASPLDEESFLQEQKYLDLALDEDDKAELCLLSAETESEMISHYLQAEIDYDQASPREKQTLQPRLNALAKRMEAAAYVSLLTCMIEDHSLRGNIRYLKNFLKN